MANFPPNLIPSYCLGHSWSRPLSGTAAFDLQNDSTVPIHPFLLCTHCVNRLMGFRSALCCSKNDPIHLWFYVLSFSIFNLLHLFGVTVAPQLTVVSSIGERRRKEVVSAFCQPRQTLIIACWQIINFCSPMTYDPSATIKTRKTNLGSLRRRRHHLRYCFFGLAAKITTWCSPCAKATKTDLIQSTKCDIGLDWASIVSIGGTGWSSWLSESRRTSPTSALPVRIFPDFAVKCCADLQSRLVTTRGHFSHQK